ncbi:9-O-acetylesterase [bacterium]|nr:MAG: 9-O-acetylesterase [bacterium]
MIGVATIGALDARADVRLDSLFTDNMVLQREKPVPVWGTAKPGERVTVSVAQQKQSAVTDANGAWKVTLKAMPGAQKVPFEVRGDNRIELQNVAVGDVFICSGQSNMEFNVSGVNNAANEIAAANFPNVRLLTVPRTVKGTRQTSFVAPVQWDVCSPKTVSAFSAVGYFFGRELNQRTGIPIGLIHASWGGTVAEAWVSRDTMLKRDDFKAATLKTEQIFNTPKAEIMAQQNTWFADHDPGSKADWQNAEFDDSSWKTMTLPASWENAGMPDFDGITWFRKTVEIPAAWAGKDLTLSLGSIDDSDTTFFNGEQIGDTVGWLDLRNYTIPANKVKAGNATIAVRVLDTGGLGGLAGNDTLSLSLKDNATQKIDLSGQWNYQPSTTFKELGPLPISLSTDRGGPNQPTVLYNGMIGPLEPFAVRGAIWYQGESNADRAQQYRTLLPDLIHDWRTRWNAKADGSDFAFYIVQLANFMARKDQPVESGWAELRDAQYNTLRVPGTGMASAIDIGDGGDIHPRNKQDVGKRLALNALAKIYGQKVEYTGPSFGSLKIEGNTARVNLTHAGGFKTSDGGAPRTFALQGADGKWYAATARIEGSSVLLSSDAVPAPKAVRYAWANNPDVNLFNSAGLPANPFRTDAP